MPATVDSQKEDLPSSLSRVTVIRYSRTQESSTIARLPRFQSLSRTIIKRCIYVGRNIARRAITRSKHDCRQRFEMHRLQAPRTGCLSPPPKQDLLQKARPLWAALSSFSINGTALMSVGSLFRPFHHPAHERGPFSALQCTLHRCAVLRLPNYLCLLQRILYPIVMDNPKPSTKPSVIHIAPAPISKSL